MDADRIDLDEPALRRLGDALRARGYTPGRVARALGIIAWNGPDLDGPWWSRRNLADGPLADLVDLFARGARVPRERAAAALPVDAWDAGAVEDAGGETRATGTILPLEADLVWTDRADRAFAGDDGLFLPDSTTLAVRRCLPPFAVGRHLDLGCGGGAVAARAARSARETVALDLNPRAAEACRQTAALSGLRGVAPVTGTAAEARALGRFDRVTFVLPLLVPWTGLSGGPVHTVARASSLLAEVVADLPALLAPGGIALLYTQEWTGGDPVAERLRASFGDRLWRAVFWWDHEGASPVGTLRSGVLAVRADASGGWSAAPVDAPDVGVDDWWPWLARLLAVDPRPAVG